MLIVSLVLSIILLVVCNIIVWRKEKPSGWIGGVVLSCVAGIFLPLCLATSSTVVFLQAVLLFPSVLVCAALRRRQLFLPLSVISTIAALGICSWFAYQEVTELRRQWPYISIEDRLPLRKASSRQVPLPPATEERLSQWEGEMAYETSQSRYYTRRIEQLKQLHEGMLQVFINSSGFGVTRMDVLLRAELRHGPRKDPPVPQPGEMLSVEWSLGPMQPSAKAKENSDPPYKLRLMHWLSITDFIHPSDFGFVKDRRHVAGFQEHQFSKVPQPDTSWKLVTVDLVGLVVHKEPVAYVSANLPRMNELRKASTRPLDEFETLGLKELRRGDDLFVRDVPRGRRVLGAIRSIKQCITCHGGNRGELLGAFSYALEKAK